jgi:hypothetical protein
MTERWKRKQITDNNGKNLTVHYKDDYEICLNLNRGQKSPGVRDSHGDHWWFEITCNNGNQEVLVGEAPTLATAKRKAAEHAGQ